MTRLEYLAGRIDWDTCLRRMLPRYPALAWVRDHAPTGALTLAVGTHARAYVGDPATMDCPFDDEGPFPPEEVRQALGAHKYTYLILPRQMDGPVAAAEFSDANFLVFRLP